MGAAFKYWDGALKKMFLVGVWRLYFYFPTTPKTLRPGSRLMVVYLVYAGVGYLGALFTIRVMQYRHGS